MAMQAVECGGLMQARPRGPRPAVVRREPVWWLLVQVHPGDVMFRGLCVRMAIAYARITKARTHHLTMRVEYEGPALQEVQAINEAPHGGQIICGPNTFAAINAALGEVVRDMPTQPDYAALVGQMQRCVGSDAAGLRGSAAIGAHPVNKARLLWAAK